MAAKNVSFGYTRCKFGQSLDADGIEADLILDQCQCESDVRIRGAQANALILNGCSVGRELDLAGSRLGGFHTRYLRAPAANQFGPLFVKGPCFLLQVQFGARIHIEVEADNLDLSGAQLKEGGHILVDRAQVHLNQLTTGRALHISGRAERTPQPAILSLQDADAGAMTLSRVDLSRCLFYGSHDLGKVTIEPTVTFATTPSWYYARRHCIADEFAWRLNGGGFRPSAWSLPGCRPAGNKQTGDRVPNTVDLPALRASQVACVYRELRRSFEAKSDEPSAADFYYGEMEMRRYNREAGLAERLIVWMYWLISGYGLRSLRAFVCLTVLMIICGLVMSLAGFAMGPVNWHTGLLYCISAPFPSVYGEISLTTMGRIVTVVVRVLSPILFAMGLLAIRGRVKR